MKLNKMQNEAVREIDNNIFVSASAGTGKTAVLVERFFHILEDKKVDIASIVAITFTEKAAYEMKRRIFDKILLKTKDKHSRDYDYWKKVKKRFIYANISTIHSFCSKIIRENAFELAIDPDFALVDENHLRFELAKFIKEKLTSWNDDKELKCILSEYKLKDIISILQYIFIKRDEPAPFINILNKSESEYFDFISCAFEKDKDSIVEQFILRKEDIREEYNLWNSLYTSYLTCAKETNKKVKPYINKLYYAIQSLFTKDKEQIKTLSYIEVSPIYEDIYKLAKAGKDDIDELQEKEIALYNFAYRFCAKLSWMLPLYIFNEKSSLTVESLYNDYNTVRRFVNLYKRMFSALKEDITTSYLLNDWASGFLLTFSDMQSKAKLLLNNKDAFAIKALKDKIEYIMLDEAQDIDSVQKDIIEVLAFGEDEDKQTNLFVVGDEKQSIYKFRGANISSFKALREKIDKSSSLTISYRSSSAIISFINVIFKSLMKESYKDFEAFYEKTYWDEDRVGEKVSQTAEETVEDRVEDRVEEDLAGGIELLVYSSEKTKDEDINKEALGIASRIAFILKSNKDMRYGDIAVLFRSLKHVSIYEKALKDKSIPFVTSHSGGFYNNKEIVDCLNILKCIDDGANELALCAVLRSPFCGLLDKTLLWLTYSPDASVNSLMNGFYNFRDNALIDSSEKDKIARLFDLLLECRQKKDRTETHELLKYLLDESLYIPCILSKDEGSVIKQNIGIFLLKLKSIADNGWSLSETLSFIENVEVENDRASSKTAAADKVLITTIHQSKGREFPVVIIPNINRQRNNNTDTIFIDKDYGIAIKSSSNSIKEKESFLYNHIKQIDKRKEIAESKRLLYVAMTRAKDYLILSGTVKTKTQSPFDLKTTVTWSDYILDILYREKASFRNWLLDSENNRYAEKSFSLEGFVFKALLNYETKDKIKPVILPISRAMPRAMPRVSIGKTTPFVLNRISPSSLMVYNKCLRRFYYKFILNIKESEERIGPYKYDNGNKEEENITTTDIPLNLIGSLVHKILEGYKDKSASVKDFVLSCLRLERLPFLFDDEQHSFVENRVGNFVSKFINSSLYEEIKLGINSGEELNYNEVAFSYHINGVLLEGAIDKIYKNKEGQLCVLDYKTNNFNQKVDIKKIESKNKLYKAQMEIYWLITTLMFPAVKPSLDAKTKNLITASLYYCDIDRTEEIMSCDLSLQQGIQDSITSSINSIQKGLDEDDIAVFHTDNAQREDCLFCGYFMCKKKSA